MNKPGLTSALGACLMMLAVVACAEPTPTPTPTPNPSSASASGFLGIGTQDVWLIQQFERVESDGSRVDVLSEIVEEAYLSTGPAVPLAHGLVFHEAVGLSGKVVSLDGTDIPSIGMTLGVITGDGTAPNEAQLFLGSRDDVLVAITSADLDQALVNVEFTDLGQIDLTNVSSIAVGDAIRVGGVFVQTLAPDDASGEQGLTALEVFERRWIGGDIQVLGIDSPGGSGLVPALLQDFDGAIKEGSALFEWFFKSPLPVTGAGVGKTLGFSVKITVVAWDKAGNKSDADATFTIPAGCSCEGTRTRSVQSHVGQIQGHGEQNADGTGAAVYLVSVADASGNPVVGSIVSGFVSGPGLFVSDPQVETDEDGVAVLRVTVPEAGDYQILITDIADAQGNTEYDSASNVLDRATATVVVASSP